MNKSSDYSESQELTDAKEDYLRNKLRTWLKDTLLASLSTEQAKHLSKLMSIFYASNSVTREVLAACKSKARRFSKDFDDTVERGACAFGEYDRYSDEYARDQKRRRQLKLLTYREEVIVKLLTTNQVTQVANMLGVTQGRISQIKAKITEKMQIANIDKALKVDWITL